MLKHVASCSVGLFHLFKLNNSIANKIIKIIIITFEAVSEKKERVESARSPLKYNKKKQLRPVPHDSRTNPTTRAPQTQPHSFPSSNCSSPHSLTPADSPPPSKSTLPTTNKRKKLSDHYQSGSPSHRDW